MSKECQKDLAGPGPSQPLLCYGQYCSEMTWEQSGARALPLSWNAAGLRSQKAPYSLYSHKSYAERVNKTTNQDTLAPHPGVRTEAAAGGGGNGHSWAPCHHALSRLRDFRELGGVNPKNGSWANPNSFPDASSLDPEGNQGALGQRSPPPAAWRPRSGWRWLQRPALRREGKPTLTLSSSGDRSRSHTPLALNHPHGDLKTSANLEKQLFRGSQTAKRKAVGLARGKAKETRTKGETPGGPDAWARAARRLTRPAAKEKHKSPTASWGRKDEKGSAGSPSPPQGRDPREQ